MREDKKGQASSFGGEVFIVKGVGVMLIWLLVIAGVVILDQASKAIVMYGLKLDEVGEHIAIIPDVFHFTHVRNTGAAFGMLGGENQRWIFIVISTIGIGALLVYLWKFRPKSKWACSALSMIIGGGIGNMIDRCFRVGIINGEERHYVFDFLDFCAFPNLWKWTFNVADAFVCVGAGILMVWCIASLVKEMKEEKRKKALDGNQDTAESCENEPCESAESGEASGSAATEEEITDVESNENEAEKE